MKHKAERFPQGDRICCNSFVVATMRVSSVTHGIFCEIAQVGGPAVRGRLVIEGN
jgi:hypothetical protein